MAERQRTQLASAAARLGSIYGTCSYCTAQAENEKRPAVHAGLWSDNIFAYGTSVTAKVNPAAPVLGRVLLRPPLVGSAVSGTTPANGAFVSDPTMNK